MTIRFDNRVAVVTGADNGLGRSVKVVVHDPGQVRAVVGG